MNPFRKIYVWYLNRKNARLMRKYDAKKAKEADFKAREEVLRAHVVTHVKALELIGFNCSIEYATGNDLASARVLVVAPDKTPYTLIVYPAGGYRLESIKP